MGHLPALCAASTCRRALPCCAQIVGNARDVLDHADLIVDVHDGHQHGVRLQRRGNLLGLNEAAAVRRQIGDPPAAPFEFAAGIEHRLVLGAPRHDVPAALAVIFGDPEDRQVVRFGGTRGPHHLWRRRPHARRHLRARRLHQCRGGIAEGMAGRGRIAEFPFRRQASRHRGGHPRIDGSGRRMVQVHGTVHSRPSRSSRSSRASRAPVALVAQPLRRLAPPALHRAQDAAHDVEFIAVELGAVEQSAQAVP